MQDRLTSQPDLSDQQARGQVMTLLRAGHQAHGHGTHLGARCDRSGTGHSAELEAVWDAPAVQRAQPLDDASRDYSRAQEEDLLA